MIRTLTIFFAYGIFTAWIVAIILACYEANRPTGNFTPEEQGRRMKLNFICWCLVWGALVGMAVAGLKN